jgi:hypothetical protein
MAAFHSKDFAQQFRTVAELMFKSFAVVFVKTRRSSLSPFPKQSSNLSFGALPGDEMFQRSILLDPPSLMQ